MTIDERLHNWSRYYRERIILESCRSIEKRYRAPWRQWVTLSEIPHPAPIDWRDAETVEKAWKSLSDKPKLILKYTYMTRFPAFVIARKCHIKVWTLENELARAKRIIQIVLDNIDNIQENTKHNMKPAPSREKPSAQSEAYLSGEQTS